MRTYRHIYLIDGENVGAKYCDSAMNDINCLVYYFISNTMPNPKSGSSLPDGEGRGPVVVRIRHENEKNALDFIIATRLGHLTAKYGRGIRYHIVSHDKGFSAVCRYWRRMGYAVTLEFAGEVIYPQSELLAGYQIFQSLPGKKQRACANICRNAMNSSSRMARNKLVRTQVSGSLHMLSKAQRTSVYKYLISYMETHDFMAI